MAIDSLINSGAEGWAAWLTLATQMLRSMAPPPDALHRFPYIDELGRGSVLIAGCWHMPMNLELF